MPLLAAFYLFLGLASLGLPGTSGFPAELLMILSALKTHTGAGLAALVGVVLGASYFLAIYRKAFFGPVRTTYVADALDLRRREVLVVLALALVVLTLGLYPRAVLDVTCSASEAWVSHLDATAATGPRRCTRGPDQALEGTP
jgi:NADH-quinone oxidoreductase subunit M